MEKRKPLLKKDRFEVFKRDSFKCQYCGASAPEKILEVDHINPVSKGGDNSITNLITACFDCNRGKGKRKINDNSIIEKQRKQIEELNIKRQQLEMLLEWKNGLKDINNEYYISASEYFNKNFNFFYIKEERKKETFKKEVDKYGLSAVLSAIDKSINFYKSKDENLENTMLCLSKVGGILNFENMPDFRKDIYYIKNFCKYNFSYINEKALHSILEKRYKEGFDLKLLLDNLKDRVFKNQKELFTYLNS